MTDDEMVCPFFVERQISILQERSDTMKKRDAMDKLLEDTRRYAERFPNLCDSAFWLAFLKRVEELWEKE
jgi:hypothetical protein